MQELRARQQVHLNSDSPELIPAQDRDGKRAPDTARTREKLWHSNCSYE